MKTEGSPRVYKSLTFLSRVFSISDYIFDVVFSSAVENMF